MNIYLELNNQSNACTCIFVIIIIQGCAEKLIMFISMMPAFKMHE